MHSEVLVTIEKVTQVRNVRSVHGNLLLATHFYDFARAGRVVEGSEDHVDFVQLCGASEAAVVVCDAVWVEVDVLSRARGKAF